MIARARCRLAMSRRSALADRDAAGESGGRPRSWSHPNNRWGRIGGPTSQRIPRMASALGCSLFDSMCLEIGRRNVAFEQAQQTRIGRRSNRRTPVRSGSFPSAHLSDAQLLPNSRDGKARAGASCVCDLSDFNTKVNSKTWGSWCAFLYAEEAVTESFPPPPPSYPRLDPETPPPPCPQACLVSRGPPPAEPGRGCSK